MVLEYHKKFLKLFRVYFFKELEFSELKFHGKLEFYKLEFKKSDRSIHIFKTVVNC